MKTILLTLTLFLQLLYCTAQTTYYSNNSTTNFNTLSGWSLNSDGTGANPAALNNTVRLIVQNGHTKNTSGIATVNQLTIQNGGTVTANNAITVNGTGLAFNINNGGTYIHNNTGTLSSTIFAGTETFGATSTFQINNWQSTTTSVISSLNTSATGFDGNAYYYGHLILNWASGATWVQGWTSATYRLAAGNFQLTTSFTGSFLFTPTSGGAVSPLVYVGGNFTMNSSGTLNFTDRGDPSYLYVNGNVTQTAGTLATTGSGNGSAGNIYTYGTGSADWTFSGGTRKLIGYRVTANKTVNIKTNFNLGQASDAGWVFTQIMVVEANAVLDVETYTISCNYATQLATSGKIRTANTNGLFGSTTTALSNSPTVQWGVGTDCTAEYYATGSQTVSAANIYENVTIMSSGTKTLAGTSTINKTFNFTGTGNYLNLNANNLTIASTGTISNASSTSYFISNTTSATNGRLRQNGLTAAARSFPIGTSTYYLPATITPATAGSDFSLSVYTGTTTDGLPGGSAFSSRVFQVNAEYRIDRASGSSNAQIRFDWQTNAIEGAAFTILSAVDIGIWVRKANWTLAAGSGSINYLTSNLLNYAATSGNLSDFGTAGTGYPYIVANILILPLKFTSVKASKTAANQGLIEWGINGGDNAVLFEVEKSMDGRGFNSIGKVNATKDLNYSFTDEQLQNGTNYYRIKAIDTEGKATYSFIVAVNTKKNFQFQIFGNPVGSQLVFQHPESVNALYRITDASGRLILYGRIPNNAVLTQIDAGKLPAGNYILQFINNSESFTQTFMKQ